MSSPDQKAIFSKLNNRLNKLNKKYGDEFVFGLFTHGENNDVEAIIIPQFEDVCLNKPLITDKLDDIEIIDIRLLYHATRDRHPEVIEALYTENYIVNSRYEHMFENLLKSKRKEIVAGIECGDPAEELKIALIKIMRTVWNDTSNAVRFVKQLTDAEKLALEGIIEAIGDAGVFFQSKVASTVGVSRLTMTNLVQKMKNCEVAEVNFLGPKGTYVRFIDDTLLNIRGENNL